MNRGEKGLKMSNNLLRFENNLYLLADFETENLNLCQQNRPWNLGFILFNNKEILEKHSYYIWWDDLKMSDGAAKATRFNYENYKRKAKPQKEVYDIWQKYLYRDDLIKVMHNGINFDAYIEQIWRHENQLKTNYNFLNNFIDTNSLAKAWKLGIKSIKREEWLENWYKYANYVRKGLKSSLTVLSKDLSIPFDLETLHDASNDCILNKLIFEQLIYKIDI